MNDNPTIDDLSKAISAALDVTMMWGGIDGADHKQWCLDQIVRKLTLTEEGYKQWVGLYCEDEDGNANEYEWDEGIPP